MADAIDLRSIAVRRVGSSPTPSTLLRIFAKLRATQCEHALIAQLVEQIPLKDKVVGSNPTGGTAS